MMWGGDNTEIMCFANIMVVSCWIFRFYLQYWQWTVGLCCAI